MHSPSICSRVYAYMYEPYKLHHAVTCDVNAFPWALWHNAYWLWCEHENLAIKEKRVTLIRIIIPKSIMGTAGNDNPAYFLGS